MNERLVSIIMPFKNTSQFLEECLQSIINQTYSNWELLAVNDNSTDSSFDLVNKFAEIDSRIKVFHNEKQGVIPALQLGYNNSIGELIARMDSDDIMVSHKMETMVANLENHGKGYLATGLVKYFPEDEIGEGFQKYEAWLNRLTTTGANFSEIYKECVIASPCWMTWRDDFEMCGGFDSEIYPEDYDLVFRFFQNKLKVIPCNEVLHLWRDYSSRTSRTHEHYADSSFIEIKLNYFLELHYDKNKNLVVWGAGKKGKFVAELLLEKGVSFQWICDNPKKIGKHIYDVELLPFNALEGIDNAQSIVSVASPKAQVDIEEYFTKRGLKSYQDYFFFC